MSRRGYNGEEEEEGEEVVDNRTRQRDHRKVDRDYDRVLRVRRQQYEEEEEKDRNNVHRRRRPPPPTSPRRDLSPVGSKRRQERDFGESDGGHGDENMRREKKASPPSSPRQERRASGPSASHPPPRGRPMNRRQSSTSCSEASGDGNDDREEVDLSRPSLREEDEPDGVVYADDEKHRAYRAGTPDYACKSPNNEEKILPSSPPVSSPSSPAAPNCLAVMQAPVLERATDLVRCFVERDRSGLNKLNPIYRLYLDKGQQPIMIATKVTKSSSTVLHFFDMTRGAIGSGLSKKGGNYVCKLINPNTAEYLLITNEITPREVMGVTFNVNTFYQQVKSGRTPRRATVMLPMLDQQNHPKAPKYLGQKGITLADRIRAHEVGENYLFQNKPPTMENGNYRLNFGGRVKLPSVKNFQLVRTDDIDTIFFQFGKVDDSRYNLDFREPFCPAQAFAAALVQFIL